MKNNNNNSRYWEYSSFLKPSTDFQILNIFEIKKPKQLRKLLFSELRKWLLFAPFCLTIQFSPNPCDYVRGIETLVLSWHSNFLPIHLNGFLSRPLISLFIHLNGFLSKPLVCKIFFFFLATLLINFSYFVNLKKRKSLFSHFIRLSFPLVLVIYYFHNASLGLS